MRSLMGRPVVLIIIHDRWTRQLIERTLSSQAYTVLTASNGATGLRLVQLEHPDVVMLELNLPELAGAQIIEDLQRSAKPTQVIVVDSYAVGGAIAGLASRVDDALARPFRAVELLNRVASVSATCRSRTRPREQRSGCNWTRTAPHWSVARSAFR
jgi:DNA-binding response OmpR family regulator